LRAHWDKFHSVDDYLQFTEEWLSPSFRLLHEKGSLFIFANQHNLGFINYMLQRLGITFLNHVVLHKTNPEPHWSGRRLACWHEAVIWGVKRPGYRFRYWEVKAKGYPDKRAGVQATDVWRVAPVPANENAGHPTQKPLDVYTRLLDMVGVEEGQSLIHSLDQVRPGLRRCVGICTPCSLNARPNTST
jgi:DNA modification methylase